MITLFIKQSIIYSNILLRNNTLKESKSTLSLQTNKNNNDKKN